MLMPRRPSSQSFLTHCGSWKSSSNRRQAAPGPRHPERWSHFCWGRSDDQQPVYNFQLGTSGLSMIHAWFVIRLAAWCMIEIWFLGDRASWDVDTVDTSASHPCHCPAASLDGPGQRQQGGTAHWSLHGFKTQFVSKFHSDSPCVATISILMVSDSTVGSIQNMTNPFPIASKRLVPSTNPFAGSAAAASYTDWGMELCDSSGVLGP